MKGKELLNLGIGIAAIGLGAFRPPGWRLEMDIALIMLVAFCSVGATLIVVGAIKIPRDARMEKEQQESAENLQERMPKAQETQAEAQRDIKDLQERMSKAQETIQLTLEKVTCARCGRLGIREEMMAIPVFRGTGVEFYCSKGFGCRAEDDEDERPEV